MPQTCIGSALLVAAILGIGWQLTDAWVKLRILANASYASSWYDSLDAPPYYIYYDKIYVGIYSGAHTHGLARELLALYESETFQSKFSI